MLRRFGRRVDSCACHCGTAKSVLALHQREIWLSSVFARCPILFPCSARRFSITFEIRATRAIFPMPQRRWRSAIPFAEMSCGLRFASKRAASSRLAFARRGASRRLRRVRSLRIFSSANRLQKRAASRPKIFPTPSAACLRQRFTLPTFARTPSESCSARSPERRPYTISRSTFFSVSGSSRFRTMPSSSVGISTISSACAQTTWRAPSSGEAASSSL
jgi:hypothetical protein